MGGKKKSGGKGRCMEDEGLIFKMHSSPHPSISISITSFYTYSSSLSSCLNHHHDSVAMSSFPRLPPECILLIAEQLLLCRDYTTLSSLLLTSKTMLTLVTPIAFGDPFGPFNNKIDFLPIGGQPPGRKLCRTLLSSRPVEQLPKLLQLVYFPEYSAQECGEYDPTPPLHFDYSLYVRHLHFSVAMPLHPDFSLRQASKQVLPLEEQIVPEITKDVELYLAKDNHVLPKRLRRLYPYSLLLDAHLRVVLTWTLCKPILERIHRHPTFRH